MSLLAGPDSRPERLRSWLFVPGANPRHLDHVARLRPHAVVLDLEDGLAVSELAAARTRVRALLRQERAGTWRASTVVGLRSHAAGSVEFEADLASIGPHLDCLLLPKVEDVSDVRHAEARLRDGGVPGVPIVIMIESARGLERLRRILTRCASVRGVAFGSEDFAADLGLPPRLATDPQHGRATILDAARAAIVLATAAAGRTLRVDAPTLDLHDVDRVHHDAETARHMGFSGKFAVHPRHVEPIHAAFRPTRQELAWARDVVARHGDGASQTQGRMVDEAVVRQARAIVDEAEAHG
jgi:citrate lyase subunit beta/citryl-CoA lyase